MAETQELNFSSGSTAPVIGMAESSVLSETRPKPVRKPTTRRQRKADPAALLSIAQSALARLPDAGIRVYARCEAGKIIITIVGATIEDKKFVPMKKHKNSHE